MKLLSIVLSTFLLVSSVTASGIIVPLYSDPDSSSNCAPWDVISTAVTENEGLPFYLIINPDSGPGSGSQPPADYRTCIPTLRPTGSVAIVLGYTHTSFGSRSTAQVEADINKYAGWSASARPTGIFFDEVSTGASEVTYYTTVANFARSKGFNFIILNPGTGPVASGYYGIADLIITDEVAFSDFSVSDLTIDSANPAEKQGVILYDSPSSPSSLISQLSALGLGAVYFTDDTLPNPYDTVPSYFATEAQEVGAA